MINCRLASRLREHCGFQHQRPLARPRRPPASRQLRPMAHRRRGPHPRRLRRSDSPTSSAASTPPTSSATTSPRISTARCSTGSRPSVFPTRTAPLHSESPGLIIDRLSILALKIYHTREEAERTDCAAGPRRAQPAALAVLEEQRTDLARCLDAAVAGDPGRRTALQTLPPVEDVQRPSLNPAIYRKRASGSGR